MNFSDSIAHGFRNFFNPTGRASRSQYIYWVLFELLSLPIASGILMSTSTTSKFYYLATFSLLFLIISFFLCNLFLMARRLHDLNFNGWWTFIYFIGAGPILFIMAVFVKGTNGPNSYGPDPLLEEKSNCSI